MGVETLISQSDVTISSYEVEIEDVREKTHIFNPTSRYKEFPLYFLFLHGWNAD